MKNKFDIDEVKKIARLSALELTDKELKKFGDQFSEILEYFDLLNEIEIFEADKEISEKNKDYGRKDKVFKSPVNPENFSPYLEDSFFKIPKVIDQEN